MASACWSSKPPNRFSSGAECGPTRERRSRRCVPARRQRGLAGIAWRAVVYSVAALVIAFALAQLWFFSHIVYWSHYPTATTAFMAARLEAMRTADPDIRLTHGWVPYER